MCYMCLFLCVTAAVHVIVCQCAKKYRQKMFVLKLWEEIKTGGNKALPPLKYSDSRKPNPLDKLISQLKDYQCKGLFAFAWHIKQ